MALKSDFAGTGRALIVGGFDGGLSRFVPGYSEFDLLVAALNDHIRDLQVERDLLRAEVERLQRLLTPAPAPVPAAATEPPVPARAWRGFKANHQGSA